VVFFRFGYNLIMNYVGLKRGTVKLAPYDEMWPRLFEAEKERLLKALRGIIFEVEHIGSTAIPGLAAKPLIDMMASVKSLSDYKKAIEPLRELGYEYMPERVLVDRAFFPKGSEENRTFHLNLVEKGSRQWEEALLFRDYLRTHPEERNEYQCLKERLAQTFAENREMYTKGKNGFISKVLEVAKNR
jgi:GrpB-like predicted nucleotidyltransferase (UPF0157 family)